MININFTLFVQIAHFLVLVWILNRLLIRPILAHLGEKTQEFEARRAAVEEIKSETASREQAYKTRLRTIYARATEERSQFEAEAGAEANQIRERALVEAKEIVERSRSEIEASKIQAREVLIASQDALAEEVAAAILGRKA